MHFRAHARRATHLHCALRHNSEQAPALLRNLGLGGALLESELRLAPGDQVVLSLPVASRWEPLSLRATVVWSEARRAGLSFASHLEDHAQIEQLPLLLDAISSAREQP